MRNKPAKVFNVDGETVRVTLYYDSKERCFAFREVINNGDMEIKKIYSSEDRDGIIASFDKYNQAHAQKFCNTAKPFFEKMKKESELQT